MKFCQPHWEELKEAIKKRGLFHLVASDGHAAMERAVAELEGKETTADYDPLMSAHWMISGRALEMGGLYLLNGDYCPLCELNTQVEKHDGTMPDPKPATVWINGCCDQVVIDAKAQGLKQIFSRGSTHDSP